MQRTKATAVGAAVIAVRVAGLLCFAAVMSGCVVKRTEEPRINVRDVKHSDNINNENSTNAVNIGNGGTGNRTDVHVIDNSTQSTKNFNINGQAGTGTRPQKTVSSVPVDFTKVKVAYPNNKQATVTIVKISQLYKWKIGQTTRIGLETDSDPNSYMKVQECVDKMYRALPEGAIVCLGLASQELGPDRYEEERRALRRAESLADACRTAMPDRDLLTLNIGVCDTEGELTPEETAVQRRVVLIVIQGIGTALSDSEIDQGIHAAIEEHEHDFKFALKHYSKWPTEHIKPA